MAIKCFDISICRINSILTPLCIIGLYSHLCYGLFLLVVFIYMFSMSRPLFL